MKIPHLLALVLGLAASVLPGMAAAQNELEPALQKLQTLTWEDGRQDLQAIRIALQRNAREIEPRLGALLASNAPPAAKDFICRELSVYGTSVSVPYLAPLLLDEKLSYLARLSLERIGGAEASSALRKALGSARADLKIGIINSLGNIGDEKAVPQLGGLLKEEATASAARLALGKIGTPEAIRALGDSSPGRQGISSMPPHRGTSPPNSANPANLERLAIEARLIAAENMARSDSGRAYPMFQQIFASTTSSAHRYGAFRGILSTAPTGEKQKLVIDALTGSDERLRRIAGEWLSDQRGKPILREAAVRLPSLAPQGQIAVLEALRRSGDESGRSAVRKALNSQELDVRVAAIKAIGSIGEAADLKMLLERATGKNQEESTAAMWALANLPGKPVDLQLTEELKRSPEGLREVVLLRTLAARHSPGANEVIQSRLRTPGQSRVAALEALAVLGDPRQIPTLVPLLASSDAQSAKQIEHTLESIVSRATGQALDPLNESYKDAPPDTRVVLVRQFGIIAGPRALQSVRAALKDPDPRVRAEAFRVLADWPGTGAAPDLLVLAKNAENESWKPLALRSFIRLCRDGDMTAEQRLQGLADAAALSRGKDQKLLLISALGTIPTLESVRRLATYLDDPEVAETAGLTITTMSDKLPPQAAGEASSILKRVIEKCPQPAVQERARASIAKLGGLS